MYDRFKFDFEDEEEMMEEDIYSDDEEKMLDSDQMTSAEAAFMRGWRSADGG